MLSLIKTLKAFSVCQLIMSVIFFENVSKMITASSDNWPDEIKPLYRLLLDIFLEELGLLNNLFLKRLGLLIK